KDLQKAGEILTFDNEHYTNQTPIMAVESIESIMVNTMVPSTGENIIRVSGKNLNLDENKYGKLIEKEEILSPIDIKVDIISNYEEDNPDIAIEKVEKRENVVLEKQIVCLTDNDFWAIITSLQWKNKSDQLTADIRNSGIKLYNIYKQDKHVFVQFIHTYKKVLSVFAKIFNIYIANHNIDNKVKMMIVSHILGLGQIPAEEFERTPMLVDWLIGSEEYTDF